MAASFMGWVSATFTAEKSPVVMVSTAATMPTMLAMRILWRAISCSRRRKRYQQLTAHTNTAPTTQVEVTVWKNLSTAKGDRATSMKLVISLRTVSGLNSQPTGYCIHALATSIHHAEMVAPSPVSHVEARWKPRDTFSQPKYMTATKVLSMKNATIPSTASGAPKMSPTNQE